MTETQEYFDNLDKENKTSPKNIAKVIKPIIYCCLCFFLMLLNVVIYTTNKTRLGVHLAFVILAINLPAIGVGSIFAGLYIKGVSPRLTDFLIDIFPFVMMIFSFFVLLGPQLFGVYKIDGNSMTPALHDNKMVLAFKYNCQIKNHDIVICIIDGNKKNVPIVKRVWATPSDTLEFIKINDQDYQLRVINHLTSKREMYSVSGKTDFYFTFSQITKLTNYKTEPEVGESISFTLPSNKYLLLGDNFYNSNDSRKYGLVQYNHITGKVVLPRG